jgi:hypothetical protein
MMSELGDLKSEDMEGMDGMLEDMLGALMSKEILYEPLKEMDSQVCCPLSLIVQQGLMS